MTYKQFEEEAWKRYNEYRAVPNDCLNEKGQDNLESFNIITDAYAFSDSKEDVVEYLTEFIEEGSINDRVSRNLRNYIRRINKELA